MKEDVVFTPKKGMKFFINKSKLFNIIYQHHKQATPARDTNGSRAIHKFTFGNSSHLDILEWSTDLLKRGFSSNSNRTLKKWNYMKLSYLNLSFWFIIYVCCWRFWGWFLAHSEISCRQQNAAGHLRDIQVLHPTGMNAAVESLQSSSELLRCQNQQIPWSIQVMMIQSTNWEISDVHIQTSTEITGNSGEHFTRDGERGVVGRGWRRWGGWSQGRRGWRWGRGWLLH